MHISRSFQYLKASVVKVRLRIEKTTCCIDASGQVSLDTTGTPHVTGFSAAVPVTSHQHSVSVCEQRQQASHYKEKQGSSEGSADTQLFPLPARSKVPAVRSQSSEEACCWNSRQRNHRQLFQGYTHLSSHCGDVSLRFGPPHKLPAHARTCLYLCRSKYWHTQRLTVTGADAVDSEFLKAFFCFMHMHKVNISVLLRALYLPDGVPQQAWVCYYYCRGTKSN